MLKRNKELQELVKKYKEEEKKKKNIVTPKAIAAPTSQDSNLVGGVSINNASMMEKSRLRRNEAPKTSLLDSLSNKKNTSNWYDSMLEKKNKATNSEGYTNTGKTYGDYYYQNYSEYKNTPIYKKDNKYYMYLDNKYQPLGKIKKNADNTITTYGYDGSNYLTEKQQTDLANGISVMTSANTKKEKLSKEDKKALLEAKKQGYKEPEGTKTKDYQKAESKFKKLQKEYNLTDEQLQEYIDTGKLSYKNLKKNLVTKSMINAKNDAEYYRKQLENGKIKKYEKNSNELTAEQRLDVETAWMNNENLSNKEKKQRLQKSVNQNIKNNKISQEATYQVGQGYLNRPLKENQSPLEKILYGTADVSANLVHGIGDFVEDVGDTLTYGVADVASKLGAKKFAKAAREQAQEEDTNTVFEPFEAKVNKGSILGQKSKSAVQSIGHTLPIMAAGSSVNGLTGSAKAAVGATSAMTFTSSFGDAKTRALNSGASNKEATQYAFVQATAETISEQIFDGIPGAKSAGWADNLVGRMGNSVTNYLGTRAGKIFEKTLNVSGEGFEEILSNVLSATGNDIVHYFDKNYKYGMKGQSGNILEDMLGAASSQESKDAFVSALLTSAILNGGQAVISTQTKNTILDAYAKDNNITRDEAKQILTDENGNINYEKIKEQINNQQENEIDTPQEVKQEVQQEIKEEVQEQPTIPVEKMNEILDDVVKKSDVEFTQEEILELRENMYKQVEKLGGKVEEIKQQQNVQEQKTPIKDAMKENNDNYKSKNFDEGYKKFKSDNFTSNDLLTFTDTTPDYFYNLGYDTSKPIKMNMEKLKATMGLSKEDSTFNQHNITDEKIQQLPNAIFNPLNVIKNPKYRNRYIVVTELSDTNGNIIITPIELNPGKEYNQIVSIYGKDTYDGNDNPNIDGYMEQQQKNIVYDIDKDVQKKSNSLDALIAVRNRSSNNNDTTKPNKSQIAPSQNSMQQNEKNTPKEKNTIEERIEKNVKENVIVHENSEKITRKSVRQDLLKEMGITEKDLDVGKHINQIDLNRTDPIRVNEKIFGAEIGKKINDATINKTKHNEAERTRFLNKERNEIKELGIKARSKESAAVQKYGEKQYVNKYGETIPYGDKELMVEFPNEKTQEKIKKAASVIRNKYDKYIVQINDVLTEMGYKPIEKRKDYMRHFQALNDVFSRYGLPLNKENLTSEDLPTDINGLTDQFKPGKQYFANAMKRMGIKTTYDAITGIDGYLEGASNLIYHTEDIQRYRALSEFVRNTYGTSHGFDNLENLTSEEAEKRIQDIQKNKLSQYAAWLDEQANALANKKGKIDRGFEEFFGRKSYNILNAAKKQVGSNMTGFNVRSAMTNFASAVQGASKTSKISFAEGTISAINNLFHKDNLVNKSDFLTSRFGSDMLAPKFWQKLSNAGQVFMNGTDYFTANQIWRSKYFENLHKGMTENQAIKNADDFAARIMGDRSKGATAQIFNSKTMGLFTQFQLEVNNQWSSLIHDNKMDIESGNKIGATVLFQTGQLFAMSHLFNLIMKSITGRDVMLDPIELLKKIFGADKDKDKSIEERTKETLDNIVDNLPFANLITPVLGLGSGGRIPISEAFKGIKSVPGVILGTEKGDFGQNLSRKQSLYNLIDSAFYWLSPTGYGQTKKTVKGLGMFINNKEIKGSYSQSGNLRFPVEQTLPKMIQAALFGENSSSEAQTYYEEGSTPLKENQQKELKVLDIPISDYWEIKSGLSDISNKLKGSKKTTEERKEIYYKYIDSLKIGKDKKNLLKKLQYKSYTESDEDIKDYISSIKAKKTTKKDLLKKMGLDD